jgi:hypothetical protein
LFGDGVFVADKELVLLLRQPPKSTSILRTKTAFQTYFRGIGAARMKALLEEAYSEIEDVTERAGKVNKRLDLLRGVLN